MPRPTNPTDGQVWVTSLGNVIQFSAARNAWININSTVFTFPRVTSITSSSTPTPNATTTDLFEISALATGATFGAPTGAANDGQKMIIRIYDNGSSQALNWNSTYKPLTTVTLPTATTTSLYNYIGIIYNAAANKWGVLSTGIGAA
jgi:hypothetical protein